MIKKRINRYPAYSADEVIRRLRPYEYISFDVFDTLIKRAVFRPEDVFAIAAGQVVGGGKQSTTPTELAKARVDAEKEARMRTDPEGEVTLEDIYSCLDKKYAEFAQEYLESELDVERRVCHADPVMKKVFDWCRAQQKKLILVSDIYLPESFIIELLASCGYDGFTSVFVSSDVGCRKITGRLFSVVLQQLGISPDQMIHIGDSLRADFLAAKRQSIHVIRIARSPIRTKYINIRRLEKAERGSWSEMRTVMSGYVDSDWEDNYRFGFEIVGPLLYGFCMWLHRKAEEHGIDRLFFCARDGYLMQKAYKGIFGGAAVENEYLYISREAVRRAQLWVHPELQDLAASFVPGCYMRIREFASYINVDREAAVREWKACGLRENEPFLPGELLSDRRKRDFFEHIKPLAVKQSKDDYLKTIEYLKQKSFIGKVAIVDLGWRGTIQNCLQNLMAAEPLLKADMIGYYMGIDNRVEDTQDKLSFIPKDQAPNEFVAAFFEYPFLSPEGSLRGYIRSLDGRIEPETHEFEYDEEEYAVVSGMQEGALYFIDCLKGQAAGKAFVNQEFSYANMRRISKRPTLREVQDFGNLTFYEGEQRYLAVPKSFWHYVLHVRDLFYDLSIAGWRIGFLKRLLRLEMNYGRLLKWYKKMRISGEIERGT